MAVDHNPTYVRTLSSVEIMETIDDREMQKTIKEKQTKAERSNGNRSYSERVRAK